MSSEWWAYGILRNHPRAWNVCLLPPPLFFLLIKLYILFGLVSLEILAIAVSKTKLPKTLPSHSAQF